MRLRTAALLLVAAAAAAGAWLAVRPSRAQTQATLYVSGLAIKAAKPVCIVRLTNVSPDAADVFLVHYTVRDTSAGIPLSAPGAGTGAPLLPGHTLELNLGNIVALYRAGFEVGPYTGPVQFVAYGEGGFSHEFGPGTIHVEVRQTEGAAIHDAAIQWGVQ